MRRSRYRRRESEGHGLLFFAVGAITGATAGVMLARRYRTGREFLDAVFSKVEALRDYWDAAGEFGEGNGRRERDVVDAYEDEYLEDDEAPALAAVNDDEIVEAAGFDDEDEIDIADEEEDEIIDAPISPRDRSSERALESNVLSAFLEDGVLRDRAIDIAAVGSGVIELTGAVRSLDEAARAASLARQVSGVSMVLNRVAIRAAAADAAPESPDMPTTSKVVRPVTPEGPAA
jgi:BON domain-containing protein